MTTMKKPGKLTWISGLALATLATALWMPPALAQNSDDTPTKIIVPFPAGGSVDAMARITAEGLAKYTGRRFIIENKPGADGAIAAAEVIRSASDGRTLLFATNTAILAVPVLRAVPPYDPITAVTAIGILGEAAFFLLASNATQATDLDALLKHAKDHPGKLNFAVANSTGQLASAQVQRLASVRWQEVPYKGEAQALPDLVAGRVDLMFASTASALQLAKEGKVKVLATIGKKRSSLAPQAGTFDELGFRGVSVVPWVGIFAPTQVETAVRSSYASALQRLGGDADITQKLAAQGLSTNVQTGAAAAKFVQTQLDVWNRLVREAGIARE